MATVHPLPRVPQTSYCDRKENPHRDLEDIDNEWPAWGFQAMSLRPVASNDMDLLPESAPYRYAGPRYCMDSSERHCSINAPLSWQADCYGNTSLPYNLNTPHNASPASQWTQIDQDTSCSGASTWSPRTSDSRSEADGYLSHSGSQNCGLPGLGTDYTHVQGQLYFPEDLSCPGPRYETVKPHSLHQYPDLDVSVEHKPELREIAVSEPYSPGDPEHFRSFRQSDHYDAKDEALGSSVKDESTASSVQDDDDSAMGDSPEVEDGDDEYKPRSDRRGHGRRLSQRSLVSKTPGLPSKRPQRIKNTTSQAVKPTKIAKKVHKSTAVTALPTNKNCNLLHCPHCTASPASESALKKHVLASHTRPFICTFQRYGCSSTVGSKNEWKRHINVQHMHLETWRCDVGTCANQVSRSKESKHTSPVLSGQAKPHESPYHEFDRKDLFTQHLKRMHSPAASASRAEKTKFENSIEAIQKRCHKRLREAPKNSICPYCPTHPIFATWDDRVEHVGKHLERSDFDKNMEIEDETLRDWLCREGYLFQQGPNQKWTLLDTGKKRKSRGEVSMKEECEEDAEGDEEE